VCILSIIVIQKNFNIKVINIGCYIINARDPLLAKTNFLSSQILDSELCSRFTKYRKIGVLLGKK